ncbi:MAG: hypothetical protein IKN27_12245 [Selenomonadaceae bacterium]|nr:hypothetical protein [Selenomonadaceae bacterium]
MSKDDFADEILSDEELDNVTGGTIFEYDHLSKLLKPQSSDGLITPDLTQDDVKNWLKTNLNIDAKINTEVLFDYYGRTCEIPNVYTQNGKTISHDDVVKQCKAFLGID